MCFGGEVGVVGVMGLILVLLMEEEVVNGGRSEEEIKPQQAGP